MKLRKLLSLLLSLCMLAAALNIALPAAAADNPSYLLKGEVSGGTFALEVYLQNAKSYGGRIAVSYDKAVLELADTDFENAVKQASGVTVTDEGHDSSVLLGDGHVLFAWYATRYSGLNATSSDKLVATIRFNLVNGASEKDFNRNTFGIYYVNETMVDGWDSSCEIISDTNNRLTAYRNTSIDEAYLCGINRDYPGCDVIPVVTYNVSVNVTNRSGKEIESTVVLDDIVSETDSYGHIDFKMPSRTYFYRITSPGYETKTGYFIVGEHDENFNVQLRSYGQIASDIADELQIGYADGDSAQSVTTDLALPTENKYGSILWTSDNNAIDEYGGVSRGDDDIPVTLTATVTVAGATAVRDFDVVVKSRLTAEEKNRAIVSQDKADLAIEYSPGDYEGGVTVKLTLPEVGKKGSSISWESDHEDIIYTTGAVKRPENDTEVTLTAYIIRGSVYDTKTFTVLVKGTGKPAPTEAPEETEEPFEPGEDEELLLPDSTPVPPVIDESPEQSVEIVNSIINALEIGYEKDDSAESVTEKLTLPTVGTESTPITWTSSLPAVITPYGGVVRQAEDTEVTLTATVTRGDVSAQKTFTVTVKASALVPENPNNGQEAEIEAKNTVRRGGGGGGGGGSGAATSPAATSEPAVSPSPSAEPSPTTAAEPDEREKKKFIDIDSVPWAQTAINALAGRGVISGTSDTTYSPNNNIRRADFVMLLVKLFEIDGDITDTFEDVTEDNYYYESVSKAKSLGVISGVDATHFNPEGSISRQDMMTMTYRALVKLGKTDDMTEADMSTFKDVDSISDYAFESVRYLVGGGYIHGDNSGYLTPLLNTTRAETAVFLYGLVK